MRRWFALVAVGAAVFVGCGDTPSTPQPTPPESVTQELSDAGDGPPLGDAAEMDRDGDGASEPDEDDKETSPASFGKGNAEPPLPPPAQRVLLFTPDGPLLLGIAITVDGEPHVASVSEFGRLLTLAFDADHDGVPRWDEMRNEVVQNRLIGVSGMPLNDEAARDAKRFFDTDGDGRVDADEALAWVERDAAADQPRLRLGVLGRRAFEPDPRAAPAWRVLDRDADGSLSVAEIGEAGTRLRGRDVNDDLAVGPQELLGLEDLLNRREALVGANVDETRRGLAYRGGYVLRTPRDTLDVRDAFALLQVGQDYVDKTAFARADNLFDRIDADSSGFLLNTEWEGLLTLPATLAARIDFTAETQPSSSFQLVSPEDTDPPIELVDSDGGPGAGRRELILPSGAVEVFITDAGAATDSGFDALRKLAEEQPIDEEAFEDLSDRPRQASFAALDLDADELLSLDEVESVIRVLGGRERLSIGLTVAAGEDPIFAALDTSGDGRLGEREIAQADERLRDLAGADGVLQPTEAPWRMRVTIHRGPAIGNAPRSVAAEQTEIGPAWFRGADYNRDGVVSRAEHIGSIASFEQLDADDDGFIDAGEAIAAAPQE